MRFFRDGFTPFLIILMTLTGCSIKLGPDPLHNFETVENGMVRMGDVSEVMTGTWSQMPNSVGFKSSFLSALQKPEVASFFNGGVSSYVMDIKLTSDHEDDGARLGNLGGLSMITLGIIPLSYHSEWLVQCQVTLKNAEGAAVAVYNLNEKGTYDIWAFPLTMLSLSGAGARGASDGKEVFKRVSEKLVDKIIQTLENDAGELANKKGSGSVQPGAFSSLQKNTIV